MPSVEVKEEIVTPLTEQEIKELYAANPREEMAQIDEVIKETNFVSQINALKSQKKELSKTLEKARSQFAKGLISLEKIIAYELEAAGILWELNSKIQLEEAVLDRVRWVQKILKQRCNQRR